MKFKQLYSSSRGNLYTITSYNGRRLLLECGVRWVKVALPALGHRLDNIDACLLTHEHMDHSKAAENVMSAGIDVWSSRGTFEALGLAHHHRAMAVGGYDTFLVSNTFSVRCFPVRHDCEEPLGFLIQEIPTGEYLHFSMDSVLVEQRHKIPGKDELLPLDIIAIELSYDGKILEDRVNSGTIHRELAKRLLQSHASKVTIMNYLADYCNLYKCREIHLLHTSADNLNKSATRREFAERFNIKTVIKEIRR